MFRETLLESAPGARRRKRWPMLLAVALEVTVCSVLIAVPLFSTGIIAVAARPVDPHWIEPMPIVESRPVSNAGGSGQGSPVHHTSVVTIADGTNHIWIGDPVVRSDDSTTQPNIGSIPSGSSLPVCESCGSGRPGGPPPGPPNVSQGVLEGYLYHRVEPVYPRLALLTGIRGEVRLHAIISKEGTIESLSVISGHPMLASAAMDAVRQWRYHPYLLNHEPVEVETLITVNFNNSR